MKTISFYTEKGGAGKTLYSLLYSSYLCYYRRKKIILLDNDAPNYRLLSARGRELGSVQSGSADTAAYARKVASVHKEVNASGGLAPYPVKTLASQDFFSGEEKKSLANLFAGKLAPRYDVAVIDMPGSLTNNNAICTLGNRGMMSLVVIPLDVDLMSIQAGITTAGILNENAGGKIQMRMFFNRVDPTEVSQLGVLTKLVQKELEAKELNEKVKILPIHVRERNGFKQESYNPKQTFLRSSLMFPIRDIYNEHSGLLSLFKEVDRELVRMGDIGNTRADLRFDYTDFPMDNDAKQSKFARKGNEFTSQVFDHKVEKTGDILSDSNKGEI